MAGCVPLPNPFGLSFGGLVTQGVRIMTSTMMMERSGMGMPGMGMPGMGTGGMPGMGTAPMAPNMMMVPRCKMMMEKVQGGMKITCTCEDQMGCSMMQNLCTMHQGGMCSCCMMMNGTPVCCGC